MRGIIDDSLCLLCGKDTKTISHILWRCDSTMDMWSKCCRSIQKCFSNEESFHHIIENLAEKLTEEELQLAAVVARHIWLR
jgi:hypothetical protein